MTLTWRGNSPAPLLGGIGVGFGKTEDRRPKTEVKNKNSSNQQPATSNQ